MLFHMTRVKASEMKTGDLFSMAGPEYWNGGRPADAVGERLFVRTEKICPLDQGDELIYRIDRIEAS